MFGRGYHNKLTDFNIFVIFKFVRVFFFLMFKIISFLSCHNKSLQTWWLKTTEVYLLTVLQVRSPKSRCGEGCAVSECSKEESFVSSNFWWPQMSLDLWQCNSSLCLSSHGLFSVSFPFLLRTVFFGFRVCSNPG